jgi:hypothetical protein
VGRQGLVDDRFAKSPIVLDVSRTGASCCCLVLTLTTVALCSVLPARRATSYAGFTAEGIRTGAAHVPRHWSLRRLLVVSQIAVTTVLLVSAALFVRSLASVLSRRQASTRQSPVVDGCGGGGIYGRALEHVLHGAS